MVGYEKWYHIQPNVADDRNPAVLALVRETLSSVRLQTAQSPKLVVHETPIQGLMRMMTSHTKPRMGNA